MPEKKGLDELTKRTIREQLADGTPSEVVAAETGATLRQVAAIKAHLTMRERKRRQTDEEMLQRAYNSAKQRARRKGLKCLTLSECKTLWEQQGGRCAIGGKRFSDKQVNTRAKVLSRPWRPSIDRIRPDRGYERENVRLVGQIVNFGLNEWPLEVFRDMCARVIEHQAPRRGRSRERTSSPWPDAPTRRAISLLCGGRVADDVEFCAQHSDTLERYAKGIMTLYAAPVKSLRRVARDPARIPGWTHLLASYPEDCAALQEFFRRLIASRPARRRSPSE